MIAPAHLIEGDFAYILVSEYTGHLFSRYQLLFPICSSIEPHSSMLVEWVRTAAFCPGSVVID